MLPSGRVTAALTNQRRREAVWSPAVFDGPGFWPIAGASERLRHHAAFPTVEQIDLALRDLAGVSFTRQEVLSKRERRREVQAPYDLEIARGCVPTREGSWHDLMNAVVWATFPRTKRTIHALQALEITRAREAGWVGRRTRKHDALAVLDEGGVVLVGAAGKLVVFGHALYEAAAIGGPRPLVRAMRVPSVVDPSDLEEVDRALVQILEGPDAPTSPKSLVALAPSSFELERDLASVPLATDQSIPGA